MIVVVSHPDDRHAQVVLDDLASHGENTLLFDLADLPERATLTVDYESPVRPAVLLTLTGEGGGGRDGCGIGRRGGTFDLREATSIWWRRPQAPVLDAITDRDLFGFTHGEWHEALNGLYQLLDCPWMNDPIRNEIASRKAEQLRVAAELGLATPRTLMTSDADRARAFVEHLGVGQVVYKTFAATHQVWRETRLFGHDDFAALDSLRFAPVIFQELVPAVADVRVTIVGDEIYAMSIDGRGTGYEIDFRVDLQHATTAAVTLPDPVAKQLLRLMERFGLVYGAVDLRLTEDGDYVFLEINPAGEFLFAEHRAGLPITDAVSRWLRRPY